MPDKSYTVTIQPSQLDLFALLAQRLEQRPFKSLVLGSNPRRGTFQMFEETRNKY